IWPDGSAASASPPPAGDPGAHLFGACEVAPTMLFRVNGRGRAKNPPIPPGYPPTMPISRNTPDHSPPAPGRFVLGISGASGAAYAMRLLEQLLTLGHEVHLVVSDYGRRLLFDETGVTHLEFATLCPTIGDASVAERLVIHPNKDVGAVIAS